MLLRICNVFWILNIYICVYNFTSNQCIIIIVIPAMYEVIPFEKGLLYRKMWQNKCFYLSSLSLSGCGFTWQVNTDCAVATFVTRTCWHRNIHRLRAHFTRSYCSDDSSSYISLKSAFMCWQSAALCCTSFQICFVCTHINIYIFSFTRESLQSVLCECQGTPPEQTNDGKSLMLCPAHYS